MMLMVWIFILAGAFAQSADAMGAIDYEQYEDTFVDAIAVNEYPDTLVCAMDITFFDEDKNPIADSHMHTRDGQYVLRLQPGDNAIYATVDTDMTLTDKEFRLDFSEGLDVLPE